MSDIKVINNLISTSEVDALSAKPGKVLKENILAISNKIDILEAENNRLKEVEKEQDKMIMDNIYIITILEKTWR